MDVVDSPTWHQGATDPSGIETSGDRFVISLNYAATLGAAATGVVTSLDEAFIVARENARAGQNPTN
jgi:hypothetical protein